MVHRFSYVHLCEWGPKCGFSIWHFLLDMRLEDLPIIASVFRRTLLFWL